MRIGLIGNYGATNVGDDAILESILHAHKDQEIVVFSSSHQEVSDQMGVEAHPLFPLGFRSFFKNGFKESFKALKDVDVVVLGGGGLFQDNVLYACYLWAFQIFFVRLLKKPLFIYGAGVGPLNTRKGKKLAKKVFNYASFITVRDGKSLETLLELGVDHNKIEVTADPALLIPVKEPVERHKGHYLVSLRPWLKSNKNTIEVFTKFLLKLKADKGAKFTFVVMQQIKEHDFKIIDQLEKNVGGQVLIPQDFPELLRHMQETEFAIGMRYHFLMAALMTKTPMLPISYSPKVDSLFTGCPLEKYMLSVEDLDEDRLKDKLVSLSVDYNNVKVYAQKRYELLREAAGVNKSLLETFLKNI